MSLRRRLDRLEAITAEPEPHADGQGLAALLDVLERLRVPAAAGNPHAAEVVAFLDAYEAGHLTADELAARVREVQP